MKSIANESTVIKDAPDASEGSGVETTAQKKADEEDKKEEKSSSKDTKLGDKRGTSALELCLKV
jgi:hypothetical protein